MTERHDTDRWREIRALHKEHANFYRMLRGGVIIGLFVFIGWTVFQESDEPRAFGMNLWTEIAGIAVTVLIIDLLNEMRAERRYKRQLVDEAASTSNETAKHAVHVMRRRGWLMGQQGLLHKAYLVRADLRNAFLRDANLKGAALTSVLLQEADLVTADLREVELISAMLSESDLTGADLRSAQLEGANLERACLYRTDLQDANLWAANLADATLREANLQNSNLRGAKLNGANLAKANLKNVKLDEATSFDERTWMPDGRYWSGNIDLMRFIDPSHKDFWTTNDESSPAYQGGVDHWRKRRGRN